MAAPVHGMQVHIYLAHPIAFTHRRWISRACGADVVDEDVYPAELCHCGEDEGVDVGLGGDVALYDFDFCIRFEGQDAGFGGFGRGEVDVAAEDLDAVGAEDAGGGGAVAPGGRIGDTDLANACNESDAAW